jgi:hypothetical protein
MLEAAQLFNEGLELMDESRIKCCILAVGHLVNESKSKTHEPFLS